MTFPPPRASIRVLPQIKAIIGSMYAFNLAMGAHNLRAGHRRIIAGMVVVIAAVAHPTREFLIGHNEVIHQGQQLGIAGS